MIADATVIQLQEDSLNFYSKDSIVLGIYMQHIEDEEEKEEKEEKEKEEKQNKEDENKSEETKTSKSTTSSSKKSIKSTTSSSKKSTKSTSSSKSSSYSGSSSKKTTTKRKKANLSNSGTVTYGGKTYTIRKRLTVHSTAYTGSASENGGYANMTSTGVRPRAGRTLAVDPNVIPYGTRVYIPSLGGVYVAEDCGGAIKGNKLDIFMSSSSQCQAWGRRNIEIYLLK